MTTNTEVLRQQFEAWAQSNAYPIDYVRDAECGIEGGSVYSDSRTHAAWWAYRYALASAPAQPCDAGEICLGCEPRRADGSCPDAPAQPVATTECFDPMCACRGGPCAECAEGAGIAAQAAPKVPDDNSLHALAVNLQHHAIAPDLPRRVVQVMRQAAAAFQAMLSAPSPEAKAQAVPEGWKLVPMEPTDAMIQAAFDALDAYPLQGNIRRHYMAMLAAAPQPPAPSEQPKPLTEPQTLALWHSDHKAHLQVHAWDWYLAGIRAGERAHGIRPTGGEHE